MNHLNTRILDLKEKHAHVGYWQDRILAQMEYACRVSALEGGCFDACISKALEQLEQAVRDEGSIGKTVALTVEQVMMPLSAVMKSKTVICAAHAHIDMNWQWRFDETVAITIDTLRTMLDLMNEYPTFRFSQSQASVYRIIEQYAPNMLDEIRQRVKEGRWEVSASTWVEADKNLPSGESLARQHLYAKRYLSKLLDIAPESLNLDFEPDTFGHSRNVPEILANSGIEFYYHCRGYEGHHIYKWMSPSGSTVLVYREPRWYLGAIQTEHIMAVPTFCKEHDLDCFLEVYGVGDHGGGPTRRDIERIMDYNSWPIFPHFTFGHFKDFYRVLEEKADSFPTVDEELNFVFTGCYTSQSRIKLANRKSESILQEAEAFHALAHIELNVAYPSQVYRDAWEMVLFNQFHDIIPGSGVIDTREHALGLFQQTLALANTNRQLSLREIVKQIKTDHLIPYEDLSTTVSQGAGVGYGLKHFNISQSDRSSGVTRVFHVFNPSAMPRKEVTQLIVWDWNYDTTRMLIKDAQGNRINHQLLDKGQNQYWGHMMHRLLLEVDVPAYGYTTVVLTMEEAPILDLYFQPDQRTEKTRRFVMENENIIVQFDPYSLELTTIIDKHAKDQNAHYKGINAQLAFIMEDSGRRMSAWVGGRQKKLESLCDLNVESFSVQKNALRQTLRYTCRIAERSKAVISVHLDKGAYGLFYEIEVDWHETGSADKGIPNLSFSLQLPYETTAFQNDIPFGVITRSSLDWDVPASSYALGENACGKSLMLVSDSKHGFLQGENALSCTLIRSSYDPDPYPEYGIHSVKLGLLLVDGDHALRLHHAHCLNHPLQFITNTKHDGLLPQRNSFLQLMSGSAAISAIKLSEDGKRMLIRLYEHDGKDTKVAIKLHKQPKNAGVCDVCETSFASSDTVAFQGDMLFVEMRACAVCTVWLEYSFSRSYI